jgi:membrane protein DedA with SNARE-associated domain/rhodanese-related sulfurtransferase
MQSLTDTIQHYAPVVVFLNMLVARVGLPLPVVPTLMAAAALARHSPWQLGEIIIAGAAGAVISDFVLYRCGFRYGQRFLALLCRISLSPDFCVRRTEAAYARVGGWSLVIGRFVPGLSLIAVAMAGVTRMSHLSFVLLDGSGALIFVGASVALGLIFQDAIIGLFSALAELGALGLLAILCALAIYLLIRWWRRLLFIRQLRMDRITVADLRTLVDTGQKLIIVDVRSKEARAECGIIPGAIAAHPEDVDPLIRELPRDAEIIVYCACPNEESAATAAKHLKRAGFKRIRPLLGGIDAWVEAGHPVERIALAEGGEPVGLAAEAEPSEGDAPARELQR